MNNAQLNIFKNALIKKDTFYFYFINKFQEIIIIGSVANLL